jgi:hypothetical protein
VFSVGADHVSVTELVVTVLEPEELLEPPELLLPELVLAPELLELELLLELPELLLPELVLAPELLELLLPEVLLVPELEPPLVELLVPPELLVEVVVPELPLLPVELMVPLEEVVAVEVVLPLELLLLELPPPELLPEPVPVPAGVTRIEKGGSWAVVVPPLAAITMPGYSPVSAAPGTPESSPVATLKLAQVGLFWMLNAIELPPERGWKLYSVFAATTTVGVPEMLAASLALLELPSQAARAAVTLNKANIFTRKPDFNLNLTLMCHRLADRVEGEHKRTGDGVSIESGGYDGAVAKQSSFAFGSGNPAISCRYQTQDRRLCVPASRRVCPFSAR